MGGSQAKKCAGCGHGATSDEKWCYCCGKKESQLHGGFGAHNGVGPGQCPWFLSSHPALVAVAGDGGWAQLREFHKLRAVRMLQALRAQADVDAAVFDGLFGSHPALFAELFDQKDEYGNVHIAGTQITLEEVKAFAPHPTHPP